MKIEAVKGTRDFYPELQQKINYMFNIWRNVCKSFGYEEIEGPILENAELWRLKSGAEIPEQMYTLTDKSNRELALRPELTPSLARMIAAKQRSLSKPIKWYSIPRCFRYEQPQSGRLREFFQLNIDCLGNNDVYSDAEVIAMGIEILKQLKLTEKDFFVRISNRRLLNKVLKEIGVKDSKEIFRLIDKKAKISNVEFNKELSKLTKKKAMLTKFLQITKLKELDKFIKDNKINVSESLNELKELFSYLKSYGYEKFIVFDPTITRGFDYYTRTVFEFYDKKKEFRAIAGGGRYDNLIENFGSNEPISGIGFGMGDVVLSLFLEDKGLIPNYKKNYDYYITIINEANEKTNHKLKNYAIKVSQKLRLKGKVFLELNRKKLNKALDYANKQSIPNVVIIGKNEMDKNIFIIKDMKKKKEITKKL